MQRKPPSQMFDWVESSSLVVPVYKLSRENIQPENMSDIVFENAKDRDGKVSKTSVYAEAAVQRVL